MLEANRKFCYIRIWIQIALRLNGHYHLNVTSRKTAFCRPASGTPKVYIDIHNGQFNYDCDMFEMLANDLAVIVTIVL